MIVAAAISLLCACGFQLRGTGEYFGSLENKNILIYSYTPKAQFEERLKFRFQYYGSNAKVKLIEAPADGSEWQLSIDSLVADNIDIVLYVASLDFDTRGYSRDETGRANEHEITGQLNFVYLDAKDWNNMTLNSNEFLNSNLQSLSSTSSYYQNFRNPIGGEAQERETKEYLIDELIHQLTRRMQAKKLPN